MSSGEEILNIKDYTMTLSISNCQTLCRKSSTCLTKRILYLCLPWSIFWESEPCSLHDRDTLSLLTSLDPVKTEYQKVGGKESEVRIFISLARFLRGCCRLATPFQLLQYSPHRPLSPHNPLSPGCSNHALSSHL